MSRLRALWIVPVALLLHNLEEALTIGAALPQLTAVWSRWVGRPLVLPTEAQYQRSLVGLTVAVLLLSLLAWRFRRLAYVLVVVQAVMALNVGAHLVLASALGGYAPGLLTALLVEAPASAFVFFRLRREGWMTATQWRLLPFLALLLHGPGLIALLRAAAT